METARRQNSRKIERSSKVVLAATVLIIFVVFTTVAPYPQPANYFDFADTRTMFGIANFLNVATNAAFLVPGLAGLWCLLARESPGVLPDTRSIYVILFAATVLTALGSSWFHSNPNTATLIWDRLPMTLVFMSLTAAVIAEYISIPIGRKLLIPLLAIGVGSVAYWAWTESQNAGDL